MCKRVTFLIIAAAFFVAPASAQLTNIGVGPRVGYDFDWEALSLGVDARAGVPTLPVSFNVSLDYFFLDDAPGVSQSLFKLAANAIYEFGIDNQVFTPYAGGGLAISRYSMDLEDDVPGFNFDVSDTNVGLNLVGGAYFGSGNLRPFAQLYLTTGNGSAVGVTGGVLFTI